MNEENRKEAERLSTALMDRDLWTADVLLFLRRFAAQPARTPMTKNLIKKFLATNCTYHGKGFGAMLTYGEAVEVVKFIERHHGIGGSHETPDRD